MHGPLPPPGTLDLGQMQLPRRMLPGEGKLGVVNLLLSPTGVWNDNPEDDFRMPNGSIIPSDSSEETLFHYGMTCESGGLQAPGAGQ